MRLRRDAYLAFATIWKNTFERIRYHVEGPQAEDVRRETTLLYFKARELSLFIISAIIDYFAGVKICYLPAPGAIRNLEGRSVVSS